AHTAQTHTLLLPATDSQGRPIDPWGNPYVYTSPGLYGEYDLVCYGKNGVEGILPYNDQIEAELSSDITSWSEPSLTATGYEYTPTSALDISVNTVPPTPPGLPSA